MMVGVDEILDKGRLLAIVVRGDDYKDGLVFPTAKDLPFQLGLHNQKKGKVIQPHMHHKIKKLEDLDISEIFYIKKGKLKISLYNKKTKIKDIVANSGDIVYLICAHGFEFLEDTVMFEVKQGPYRSKEEDKEMI